VLLIKPGNTSLSGCRTKKEDREKKNAKYALMKNEEVCSKKWERETTKEKNDK
jgi:hypothetical protein